VDKEVAVAILLVESRFGENIGKYRVIPTFASMAMMDSPESLQKNFQVLKDKNLDLSYESVEDFAKRRPLGLRGIEMFLEDRSVSEDGPLEVYGSYAGAFGMPQFILPAILSMLIVKKVRKLALNKEEAIFSIGNYLKSHGWEKNLP